MFLVQSCVWVMYDCKTAQLQNIAFYMHHIINAGPLEHTCEISQIEYPIAIYGKT